MKRFIALAIIVSFAFVSVVAQPADEKPKTVTETLYILPKRGMEDKFEAGVKAHNQKFHPDGPNRAGLRKVEYGEKAGWYVWVFGPTTYAALDSRPGKANGHDEDWSKMVDPFVDQYGDVMLWEFNSDLSFGADILKNSKYYEAWAIDLKRGEYYRFKAMIEKMKKVYESKATKGFLIFENPIHTTNSPDVAILWSFNSYDEWSKDMGVKDDYEKMFGAGTWQLLLNEWKDISVNYSSEIRSMIK